MYAHYISGERQGFEAEMEIAMSTFFEDLLESVEQMNEIVRGERQPSREFTVDAIQVEVTPPPKALLKSPSTKGTRGGYA